MMLPLLVRKNRRIFEAMARSWLESGADAFQILNSGQQPIASWPIDLTQQGAQGHVMTAPLETRQETLGELAVFGVNGEINRHRLDHEAEMVRKWLTLEDELNSLTSELIQYQDQILMLYELSRSARHHLEFEPIVQTYLETGRKLLQVEELHLIISPAEAEIEVAEGQTLFEALKLISLPRREAFDDLESAQLEELHLFRQELLISDPFGRIQPHPWQSMMSLPVPCHSGQLVTLIAINRQLGPFDAPTKKMGLALVDLLGSELERLSLHQQILAKTRLETEAAMARTVQMRLLPRQAPAMIGLDVHGYSEPARQVGGDYYDFIKLNEDEFFFCLADVSGKGMPAALSMTNLRSAVRTAARLMTAFDVQGALHQTNESLYEDFSDVEMFATIFFGHYNRLRREITYSNGGHAPIIYCPRNEPARLLRANGPALGILPGAPVGREVIPFKVGDMLVAATDGFNESENGDGEMFGYERLIKLIEQLNHYPAAMIANILNEEVKVFRGHEPQQDDQTIVVLKGTA